jgi:HEPN domain-containing protein
MPHDPELVAETRAWIVRAAEDLRAGDWELRATPPLAGDAVFHAQQAAEKSAKAFLTWRSRPFRKTHNIWELGEACLAIDGTLEPAFLRAAQLTDYAWRYRYPGEPSEPSVEEAATALALARTLFDAVTGRLPPEVLPGSP